MFIDFLLIRRFDHLLHFFLSFQAVRPPITSFRHSLSGFFNCCISKNIEVEFFRLSQVMKTPECRIYLLVVCLAVSALESCDSQPSTRILLIGNSYTFINGGLDKQLKGLAPSAETECIAIGGYRLENHWNNGNALRRIRETKWDYVVLQEQSQIPVINQKQFYDFAEISE